MAKEVSISSSRRRDRKNGRAWMGEAGAGHPNSTRTALFVAHFDERSQFVYQSFRAGIHGVAERLNRQIELQRADALPSEPDLMTTIKRALNGAVFAVCDITPGDSTDQSQWSPNVFYELGMADQLGLPVYIVCDKKRQPTSAGPRLPFDIITRYVSFYDFTPEGLGLITERFARWLFEELDKERGRISAYEQSQSFVRTARDIKNAMYDWRGAWAASFRQLLARVVTPLQSETMGMTTFLRDLPGPTYRFEPLGRSDAVGQFFIAMVNSLEPGDEYLTRSTLPFWQSLKENGETFLTSCRKAVERGVVIRRLLLVPDRWNEEERRLVEMHIRAQKLIKGTYTLKIERVLRDKLITNEDRRIGSISRRKELGVTTAFSLEYDKAVPPQVLAITLRDDAEDAAREFDDKWKETPDLNQQDLD